MKICCKDHCTLKSIRTWRFKSITVKTYNFKVSEWTLLAKLKILILMTLIHMNKTPLRELWWKWYLHRQLVLGNKTLKCTYQYSWCMKVVMRTNWCIKYRIFSILVFFCYQFVRYMIYKTEKHKFVVYFTYPKSI